MVNITICNASLWYRHDYPHSNLIQYSPHLIKLKSIEKFADLLKPSLWKNRYGAFAQVWSDEKANNIFLIRDHFGCEPLYYHLNQKQLVFASNLPDLLKQLPYKPQYNAARIVDLLSGCQQYSDETYYQNIYRVEPGSWVHIANGHCLKKEVFWRLDAQAKDLKLNSDESYFECFSDLLNEAVRFNCADQPQDLAGELSGGLDSSAILASANQQNFRYPLFLHLAPHNSEHVDDASLAKLLLKQLQMNDVHFIGAENFDPLATFRYCAKLFAGPAPYIFPMLSYNITSAVAKQGRKILLSGAGGDECVSSHAIWESLIPNLLHKKGFLITWQTLQASYKQSKSSFLIIRRAEQLLKYSCPFWFYLLSRAESSYQWIKQCLENGNSFKSYSQTHYYPSVRAFEWERLQGPQSQVLRGRIEYCAVLAKSLGFQYRYPLLYPKLVDFCFHLPVEQKYRQGKKRYLMRCYLRRMGVPKAIYEKQQKIGGIIPATLDRCLYLMNKKTFDAIPLEKYAKQDTDHHKLISIIHSYMLHGSNP